VGSLNSREISSEPNCRAVQQQRVRKQQVQNAIHGGNLTSKVRAVNCFFAPRSNVEDQMMSMKREA
jgi:hypothetical protein